MPSIAHVPATVSKFEQSTALMFGIHLLWLYIACPYDPESMPLVAPKA